MTDTITLPRSVVSGALHALDLSQGLLASARSIHHITVLEEYKSLRAALGQQAEQGWVLTPLEPTEQMWGGLARDIVFWLYMNSGPHYGSKMHGHLRNLGTEIPDWLLREIPDTDSTPPKGTVAAVIYKAMLAAAPKGGV